jgi:serine/threonine protein kinase
MVDLIGKQLGKWLIDRELGRGGMGRVYLAHEEGPPPGQPAAIKVLSAELAQEVGFLERFQREIDVLRQLKHPHIVRLFDSGYQDGHYYYAMEYLPGQNFDDLVLARGRLPWREVLEIALQICPALKHAHDHGIIHRDLKPQNLLRTAEGVIKLTDFGIAKVFAGKQLTVTGGLVGTAEYLSPEQASGKPVTHRSDLYSFGVVLYTLLTGRTPFQGRSTLDLMHKHRFAQFDPPHRVVPEIPHDLDRIVCGLLEKEPANRPANGLVLQRQLETFHHKMQRREQRTVVSAKGDGAPAVEEADEPRHEDYAGPATLMSQLVRQELTEQQRAGPINRWLNKPWVLIPVFVASVSLIALGLLSRKGNSNPEAEGGAAIAPETEGQVVYDEARRLYRAGDWRAAQTRLQNLVNAFDGVEAEKYWVGKARRWLDDKEWKELDTKRKASVDQALTKARALWALGKQAEARKILDGLEGLYGEDPSAQGLLDQIHQARIELMGVRPSR